MKVSIVTISFNQAQFLEQAILSVLEQDYQDVEYIVVDPGSTDGSRGIIEKYKDRIDKIIFEPDNGPADGLNKGFAAATGEIFGYLNSDDLLLEGAVSSIMSAFIRKKYADVISGHAFIIDDNNIIKKRVYSHKFNVTDYAYGACILVQQSTFFKKKIFEKVGGFNQNNKVCWDGEQWIDFAIAGGQFRRIHKYLSAFRIYDDTITGSGDFNEEIDRQHQEICKKIGNINTSFFNCNLSLLHNRLSDPIGSSLRFCDCFRSEESNNPKILWIKK